MATYTVEKRESGSNWYRYTTASSEYSATVLAESAKRTFPGASFRVLDDKGNLKFLA